MKLRFGQIAKHKYIKLFLFNFIEVILVKLLKNKFTNAVCQEHLLVLHSKEKYLVNRKGAFDFY